MIWTSSTQICDPVVAQCLKHWMLGNLKDKFLLSRGERVVDLQLPWLHDQVPLQLGFLWVSTSCWCKHQVERVNMVISRLFYLFLSYQMCNNIGCRYIHRHISNYILYTMYCAVIYIIYIYICCMGFHAPCLHTGCTVYIYIYMHPAYTLHISIIYA